MTCVCHTSLVSMPRNFLVTNLCLQIFIIINLIIFFILFILNKHFICFRMHCHQFIMLSYEYRVLIPKKKNISYPSYNIRMPIFRITALCCMHMLMCFSPIKVFLFSLSLPFSLCFLQSLPFSS